MSFTQGDGMVLCIESVGPSRSGFSSSSSVMSAVLSALYTVSGQSQMLVQLEVSDSDLGSIFLFLFLFVFFVSIVVSSLIDSSNISR